MKIEITYDSGNVYKVGKIMDAHELIEDYIDCVPEGECADVIDFLRNTDEQTALDFVANGWGIGYIIIKTHKTMEETKKQIWVRIGAFIDVTDEELQTITNKGEKGAKLLKEKIESSNIVPQGDTYIPMESVEIYNEDYDTDIQADDDICFYFE